MKNAYVTFTRTVRVENVEGLTEEQIRERAVDVHNEAEMDDFYASEEDIVSIDIREEKGDEDVDDE
jgi:hypothetical protein